jgi:hypothetical protein
VAGSGQFWQSVEKPHIQAWHSGMDTGAMWHGTNEARLERAIMKLYTIQRLHIFSILAEFPDIGDFIQHAGSIWVEVFLTQEQFEEINKQFPNQVYL